MAETLIERLAAASEGSRELDRAIMEAVYLPTLKQWNGVEVESWWADGDSYGCNTVDGWRHEKVICLSQWTRSIDAALSLLPEGCAYEIGSTFRGEHWASVESQEPSLAPAGASVIHAATAPLALVIAALRARPPESGRE